MRIARLAPTALVVGLVAALALTAGTSARDLESDPREQDRPKPTKCEGGYPCIHPEAVCCPELRTCCPSGTQCPLDPGDECVYTEPEDSGVPR
jgi:hypothetical protein